MWSSSKFEPLQRQVNQKMMENEIEMSTLFDCMLKSTGVCLTYIIFANVTEVEILPFTNNTQYFHSQENYSERLFHLDENKY